jgi:hypothetical protein
MNEVEQEPAKLDLKRSDKKYLFWIDGLKAFAIIGILLYDPLKNDIKLPANIYCKIWMSYTYCFLIL